MNISDGRKVCVFRRLKRGAVRCPWVWYCPCCERGGYMASAHEAWWQVTAHLWLGHGTIPAAYDTPEQRVDCV